MAKLRKTAQLKLLVAALLENPGVERYAYELYPAAGRYAATSRNGLRRLVEHGWLEGRDEEGDPVALGRPLRIYYRLLPGKIEEARAWLATAGPLPFLEPIDLD